MVKSIGKQLFQVVQSVCEGQTHFSDGIKEQIKHLIQQSRESSSLAVEDMIYRHKDIHMTINGHIPMTIFLLEEGVCLKPLKWASDKASEKLYVVGGSGIDAAGISREEQKLLDYSNAVLASECASVDEVLVYHGTVLHSIATNATMVFFALMLLEKGASMSIRDRNGRTALHVAVRRGNVDLAKAMLSKGAPLNVADNEGRTALHMAVNCGNVDLVKAMLSKGATVNAADNDGRTPLFITLVGENLRDIRDTRCSKPGKDDDAFEIARLLMKEGAELRCSDNDGKTILHAAAVRGDLLVGKFLVEAGVDVNAKTKFDRTPLHEAACSLHEVRHDVYNKDDAVRRCADCVEFARLLLANGARTDPHASTIGPVGYQSKRDARRVAGPTPLMAALMTATT